jgi:hypothetical protein
LVRINRFEKTNGMAGVFAGAKTYTMWYRAELEVVKPFYTESDHSRQYPCLGKIAQGSARDRGGSDVPKGAVFEEQGSMDFFLTENGWNGNDACH